MSSQTTKVMTYNCKCGKTFSGEYTKIITLTRMHHKKCAFPYEDFANVIEFNLNKSNPKANNGEKKRQQHIQNLTNQNPHFSSVSPPTILS